MEKANGKRSQLIPMKRISSISLMVTMKWTKNTDMVNFSGNQATSIQATTIKMRGRVMVQWNGRIAVCTKDTGSKVLSMVLVL